MDLQINPQRCPLCGQPNQCAMSATPPGPRPCWCEQTRVNPESLARLAPEQRGKACLCARCAQKAPA